MQFQYSKSLQRGQERGIEMFWSSVSCPQRWLVHLECYRWRVKVAALFLPANCKAEGPHELIVPSLLKQACYQGDLLLMIEDLASSFPQNLFIFFFEGWSHCNMSSQSWLWSVLCTVRFMDVGWESVTPATQCSVLTLIILALHMHNPASTNETFFLLAGCTVLIWTVIFCCSSSLLQSFFSFIDLKLVMV